MYKLETKIDTFKIHSVASELTFSQFCDFVEIDNKLHGEDSEDKEILMVQAVKVFVPNAEKLPLALEEIYNQDYKTDIFNKISVYDLYIYYTGLLSSWFDSVVLPALQNLSELDEHQEKISSMLGATTTVYEKCKAVLYFTEFISGCKVVDNTFSFSYKGHWYYIDGLRANSFFYGKSYKSGEVVEVKEFRRRMSDLGENTNLAHDLFRIGLHDMAVLALRKGEKLPYDIEEREALINSRMLEFQELPLDIVFEVCFFLINSLQNVTIRIITKGFGAETMTG